MTCGPSQVSDILGDELIAKLREAGFAVVPLNATRSMRDAAANAMRRRQDAMGIDWFPVSNKAKAGIRWDAMIAAWMASETAPARDA